MVRVLVADDQTLFRTALAQLLDADPEITVVGEASDGAEAVRLARSLRPDVILMDLKMPNLDGVQATSAIMAEASEMRVMILTMFEGEGEVMQALNAGARGYLLKDATPRAIVCAIHAASEGARVLLGAAGDRVVRLLRDAAGPGAEDGLTRREVEILTLVASGLPNKQIALRLGVSIKTVRNHVGRIYGKLDIFDRSQAVLYAVRKGLVLA